MQRGGNPTTQGATAQPLATLIRRYNDFQGMSAEARIASSSSCRATGTLRNRYFASEFLTRHNNISSTSVDEAVARCSECTPSVATSAAQHEESCTSGVLTGVAVQFWHNSS